MDVTEHEQDFGFAITEEPSGVRAVVVDLRTGLRAAKVRIDDATTEYAICNVDLRPLYPSARSLDELRARFPRSP